MHVFLYLSTQHFFGGEVADIIVAFVGFGFVVSLNFGFLFSLGEKIVVPTTPCSIINVAHVSLLVFFL